MNEQTQLVLSDLKQLEEKKLLTGLLNVEELSYHNGPGYSRSDLQIASKTPLHLFSKKQNEKTASSALVFGSAFHTLMLEPELFTTRFASFEKVDRRKKEVKECLSEGRQAISFDDWERLDLMSKALMDNPIAKTLLEEGQKEMSAYWNDSETNLLLKAKADIIYPRKGIVADLKTTVDASPQSFKKSISNFFYDLQGAHYLQGFNQAVKAIKPVEDKDTFEHFVFICQEKEYPFAVALYRLSDDAIEIGLEMQQELLKRIKKAKEQIQEGNHVGYPQHIVQIEAPRWAYEITERIG